MGKDGSTVADAALDWSMRFVIENELQLLLGLGFGASFGNKLVYDLRSQPLPMFTLHP